MLARHGLEAAAHAPASPAEPSTAATTAAGLALGKALATQSWVLAKPKKPIARRSSCTGRSARPPSCFQSSGVIGNTGWADGLRERSRFEVRRLTALATELAEEPFFLLSTRASASRNGCPVDWRPSWVLPNRPSRCMSPNGTMSSPPRMAGTIRVSPTDCCLALNLWILGKPEQAARSSEEAIALARKLEHHYSLVFALLFDAMLRNNAASLAASGDRRTPRSSSRRTSLGGRRYSNRGRARCEGGRLRIWERRRGSFCCATRSPNVGALASRACSRIFFRCSPKRMSPGAMPTRV